MIDISSNLFYHKLPITKFNNIFILCGILKRAAQLSISSFILNIRSVLENDKIIKKLYKSRVTFGFYGYYSAFLTIHSLR